MRKLMFVAGAAVGYVLGARAGRERYEKIAGAARNVAGNPAVRNSVDSAVQAGRQAAAKAADAVGHRAGKRLPEPLAEKLRAVRDKAVPMDDDWGQATTAQPEDGRARAGRQPH
ncbi:hypothetical protein [Streptomyces aidingensis]|uniref:YtxH domain-containing protein n=1 Tax=Streptomyces aidingensis TaxID=910347 RepID=A0A1I1FUB0_9ACTN|nr:hypothetical protein [Streptomyces aidingensis]SFC03027.1 hypothetical protein SAMN05421773_101879 [Streptomyces aidingensis]